jgi:hypothetical protein
MITLLLLCHILKGQCHEIFDPRFFPQNIRPGLLTLIKRQNPFRIYCKFEFAKIFEFLKMQAVSLTPHARTTSKSENHMQNSDGMQKN